MKNRQIFEIHQALKQLDGCPNQTTNATIPYQFTGNVAYAIGKNLKQTSSIVQDVQETYQKLLLALLKPDEKGLQKGDIRIEALSKEYEKVLDIESEYKPYQFPLSGLGINTNKIPPSVLAVLDFLIIDDTPAPTPPKS